MIPLGVASASVADAGIHKKFLGSGTTTLIISNEELEDIMKIVKSLEYPGLLVKGISETIQNEAKELQCEFLVMLLRKLDASLLGNMLTGKGVKLGNGVNRAGGGINGAGYGNNKYLIKDF